MERRAADNMDKPGPYEASLAGNPIADPERPLEVLRTIHSFDPCIACAVHMLSPEAGKWSRSRSCKIRLQSIQLRRNYALRTTLRLEHPAAAVSLELRPLHCRLGRDRVLHPLSWTNTLIEGETSFPVGTMRYIHFVAGFVFTGSILARLYLLIFGNRQERIWDFLPVTPTNIRNLFCTLAFICTVR